MDELNLDDKMVLEYYNKLEHAPFEGATLILPVVSHGNVGQLAADLLIYTLGLERVVWAAVVQALTPGLESARFQKFLMKINLPSI